MSAEGDSLDGRVALVTGAARGIGLEVAKVLAQCGAKVALCDLHAKRPAATVQVTQGSYFCCDVTDPAAVAQAVGATVEHFGGLHILVNNAGVALDGLLLRAKQSDWEKTLQVNLTGAFNCCKAAAKHLLRAREAGRVVNISSIVGEQGNTGQAAYAASKAGLIGLTRSLAREFAGRGVTVNAIAPGFIETRMTEERLPSAQREQLLAAIPLGRMGTTHEVAGAVRYLCSPAASYITGQVLRVNGGLYM